MNEMNVSHAVVTAQRKAGFKMRECVLPFGTRVVIAEMPKLSKDVGGMRYNSVMDYRRRMARAYPGSEIYLTMPSKITREWQPTKTAAK